jgi:hypothetical protein
MACKHGGCGQCIMDAFDQLAWVTAKAVLAFERKTPGQQDPAVLRAAKRVLQILATRSKQTIKPENPKSANA